MLFNSFEFGIFLPIVFILYWFVFKRSIKLQNALLLVSSYVFYGWWDYRFLTLIIISSFADFLIGKRLSKSVNKIQRKLLLYISIIINLGILGFFKYYNFFIDSFVDVFQVFGFSFNPQRLNIILPVGISFYTFQTLSYTIDVYKKKMQATNNLINFFAYVSFFPQLVAGPIERAKNLLPQFNKKRVFNYSQAADGMRQILWGLFKKVVIADNCAVYVNYVFENYTNLNGSTLILGSVFFAFQIYADFSGYSDIAIGTARLFGFNLMKNFAFPYFSRDIAEFWRRWHISLSTWFRDYLYIPLGGSKGSIWMKIRNTFIIFIVSGFWHGANWTFIVWGALNALYFLPLMLLNRNRNNINHIDKREAFTIKTTANILLTFTLTCFAWIVFRAESLTQAVNYIKQIPHGVFQMPFLFLIKKYLLIIVGFIIVEWFQRTKEHAGDVSHLKPYLRHLFYLSIILLIFFFGNFDATQFIYFQF